MSDEIKSEFKPSQWFIDEKDAKYYRNKYLNNIQMSIKTLKKLENHIVSIDNNINQLLELDASKDPDLANISEISDIKNDISSIKNNYEVILRNLEENKQELLVKDYDKILDNNTKQIIQRENENK